jgi:hypothetical protein
VGDLIVKLKMPRRGEVCIIVNMTPVYYNKERYEFAVISPFGTLHELHDYELEML